LNVADLTLNEPDAAGNPVLAFYARKPPEYAVYRTGERVMVHYADEAGKSDEQRKALAQLSPLRGEINGLLDTWRDAPDERNVLLVFTRKDGPKLRKRADRYDRRVGDALVVGLEGDLTGAGAVLEDIKDDIMDALVGWARLEYLLIALLLMALFILAATGAAALAEFGTCREEANPLCFKVANDLWRGAMSGAVGAFFSIALAIRGRTVLPNLQRTSNLTDAALRVTIGIIAATVLVALVLSKFVNISVGASSPKNPEPLFIATVGFIAGFAERLVPDLLAKAAGRIAEAPVLRKPEPEMEGRAPAPAPAPVDARGAAEGPAAAAPAADPVPEQTYEDCCVSDVPLAPDEITPDENLPAASGGVAREEQETGKP
jgi:hypothetical protein